MKARMLGRSVGGVLTVILLTLSGGCVERTITVRSSPPGARVYLDDVEHGETPVTFDFNFYGQRELVLRKDNYETYREVIEVSPPLYSRFPIDTFFDLLWPFRIEEDHPYDAMLQPVVAPDEDKLMYQAGELREQMLSSPAQ
jgi:hypothetical protein